ncbi:MAG: phosphotransferase [Chloroflexi bacterium]|nr:phosphotransferase [Chloroflexota bacterium]
MRKIHATVVPPDLAPLMRRETFAPAGAAGVRDLEAHLGVQTFAEPTEQALAAFWRVRREDIRTLVERAEELGTRLAHTAPEFVLCHADIHTGNVWLDAERRVWIADWDETMLAPKERDLMFVVGGISSKLVGPSEEEWFFQGYGGIAVDPPALAYYRYAWAVGDIAAYGGQVFFRPDLGPVSKRAAAERFRSLFAPGEIVALAFASDTAPDCAASREA